MDAQRIGRELGVDAVLVGRVQLIGERLHVKTELVDVANGWQLWGENYDRALTAILEVQEAIAKQISAALRLKLTGEDQQRLTKRYTESGEAYQAYLQGRFHWSKFTREGLEQATDFFRQAIYLDPNYALAYAGIVDCYLRLATNYLPPADSPPKTTARDESNGEELSSENVAALEPVQTRYRWDWTGVERELKRAAELQSNYPAAHQWQAAYLFSLNLYRESLGRNRDRQLAGKNGDDDLGLKHARLEDQIRFASPTPAEEVQVFCTIAREQIEAGNYEGGCQVLKHWWTVGEWPRLEGLSYHAAGDLLFTAGSLTGWVAGAKQIPFGQRHAEALLNGSIGIFEHLGLRTRAAEGKIELGYCYYREGIFDLARATLLNTLSVLTDNDIELKSVCLIRLAITERQAGRHEKSVSYLREASQCVALIGPRVSARHHQELATALRDVGSSESRTRNDEEALGHYQKALSEFEAVGNHRYAAVVENNHGCMLLSLARLEEGEGHLLRARSLFEAIGDKLSRGQVDESVAQLHLASKRNDLAESAIASAVEALESCGYQAVLSEALKTQGVVLARLGRHREAKWVLDRASQIAERCGDNEGAGRALLVIMEEMTDSLVKDEKIDLVTRIKKFLAGSQNLSTQERLQRILERLKS
jgi:hypothetical protein